MQVDLRSYIIQKIAQIEVEIVRNKAISGVRKMEIKCLLGQGPKPKYTFTLSATVDKSARIKELEESIYKSNKWLEEIQRELSQLQKDLSQFECAKVEHP